MPRVIVLTDGGREVAGFKAATLPGREHPGVNLEALDALDEAVFAAEREQAALDDAIPTAVAQLEPGDKVWVEGREGRADWATFTAREPRMSTYRVYFDDGPLSFQDYPADAQVLVRRG